MEIKHGVSNKRGEEIIELLNNVCNNLITVAHKTTDTEVAFLIGTITEKIRHEVRPKVFELSVISRIAEIDILEAEPQLVINMAKPDTKEQKNVSKK